MNDIFLCVAGGVKVAGRNLSSQGRPVFSFRNTVGKEIAIDTFQQLVPFEESLVLFFTRRGKKRVFKEQQGIEEAGSTGAETKVTV